MAQPDRSDRRLDSWKEIAVFFGRNERTVRRWAEDRALPVHRIPGASRGRVFAFESELQGWLAASGEKRQPDTGQREPQSAEPEIPPQVSPVTVATTNPRPVWKWTVALAALAAMIMIVAFRLSHYFPAQAMQMSESSIPKLAKPETAQAKELYLQGRYYWNRRTPEDLNRAVDYFTQAIVRDPNYANAYVGLADTYNLLREYGAMPPDQAYPRALTAAKKAVEIDDSSADAHLSLAFVTFYWNWDATAAEREFKRALLLDPNNARAHHWYATFLLSCRRLPESLAMINEAQTLDPSSVAILADKGDILSEANQTDAALTLLKQIERTDPSFASPHRYLSEIYLARKDYPDYLREWQQLAILLRDPNELLVERAAEKGFSSGGYRGMLEGMLRVQKDLNSQGSVPAFSLAVTYARLGDTQHSLQSLKAAYDNHDASLLFLSSEPAFDILRSNSEFIDIGARISSPPIRETLHPEVSPANSALCCGQPH
jgi:Tfp pilus assembly protein PilF